MLNLHQIIGRTWAVEAELAEFGQRLLEAEGYAAMRLVAELHRDLNAAEAAARVADSTSRSGGEVAVIPVMGLLTHRGGVVDSAATTATAGIAARVRAMVAEPAVSAIVLEFDSPGGDVSGLTEAAEVIREARAVKPVVAVANTRAASGGYWLMSQAQELFASPSAHVGSIGVYYPHEDKSAALAAQGRKVTLVSAGKFKTEGNPFEPLGDEARAWIQGKVNESYSMFVADIAKGRGVSRELVRDSYGQGRMLGARAAKEAGMVDQVGTLEDAVRRAAQLGRERSRAAANAAQLEATKIRRARG